MMLSCISRKHFNLIINSINMNSICTLNFGKHKRTIIVLLLFPKLRVQTEFIFMCVVLLLFPKLRVQSEFMFMQFHNKSLKNCQNIVFFFVFFFAVVFFRPYLVISSAASPDCTELVLSTNGNPQITPEQAPVNQ